MASIGLGLAHAVVKRRTVPPELRSVAVAAAVGLGAIDVVYVARRRISPVYLADAAVEAAFLWDWLRPQRDGEPSER